MAKNQSTKNLVGQVSCYTSQVAPQQPSSAVEKQMQKHVGRMSSSRNFTTRQPAAMIPNTGGVTARRPPLNTANLPRKPEPQNLKAPMTQTTEQIVSQGTLNLTNYKR
jgi:hypothetical protein